MTRSFFNVTFGFICKAMVLSWLLLGIACQNKKPLDAFQIEPGFTLTRVAAEPLIKDPVDIKFNALGDALVLEMPGYPFEDKQSRIVLLKDDDGDGVFDRSQVFIENLQLANSFMPYKQGVLVAAPPYLLYVRDEDHDYHPEQVDTLMGGFSTGNLQHNYNAMTLGLDGWIYAANGGNDGAPYWWNDSTSTMDLRGQDFRFNPETKTMERLGESSGGFGLAMDDYDRVFETHNLTHISHLVFPDRYGKDQPLPVGHTLENIADHEENGLARIYPIGEQESRVNHPEQSGYFSGSCGIMFYGGGAFGPEYENTVWVADVVLNLLHVDRLEPNGASFTASRLLEKRDFLASSDRAFRPVNMTVGPDGNIYVVDMYRKVIEHPEWIPDEIQKTMDLEGGKTQGRIYRISKTGAKGAFNPAQFKTDSGLIQSLADRNQWVRKTAHGQLLDRPLEQEQLTDLRSMLGGTDKFPKLHALYLLANKDVLADADLAGLLSDADPGIQEAALIIAEQRIPVSKTIADAAIGLLHSNQARVRMQAALTLSTIDTKDMTYPRIEQGFITALNKASRLADDPWLVSAFALAAKHHPQQLFIALAKNEPLHTDLLAALAMHCAKTTKGLQTVLAELAEATMTASDRQRVVEQLNRIPLSVSGADLEPYISTLEGSADMGLLPGLAALRNSLELPPSPKFLKYSQEALQEVLEGSLTDSVRIQHLALLDLLPYREKSEVLFACLRNDQPLKLQEGALRQLARYPERVIGERVVAMWSALSPQTRSYASDLLLYIEVHHDVLLTGLENGSINIGEMNFDLERRRQLLWWTDNEDTKRRAELLFSDSGVSNRQVAIDSMQPALAMTGSPGRGADVFETVCSNCHRFGARGREVGPALTEIGRKSKETLLHDILDPNAAADPKYINHRLEMTSGQVHLGIVASETDQAITIRKMGGEEAVLDKAEIKSFRSLGASFMMEGLENSMTQQEMADLLAFLQSGD